MGYFPQGGAMGAGGTIGTPTWGDWDWNVNRGTWLVYTLPYMEQTALYAQLPTPVGNVHIPTRNDKIPYLRCPSDGDRINESLSNYSMNMGPQCKDSGCGYDPYYVNCNQPTWGWTSSSDAGNTVNDSESRGFGTRIGVVLKMASITDGTSNTIAVGEILVNSHDHVSDGSWMYYNGGACHAGTIVPINTRSDYQIYNSGNCGSPLTNPGPRNWNVSWGFKSRHTGGANFVFADGSVRFLPQSIDIRTYNQLGCRNDGQPVSVP
jgi:prepilin-type processing-associated H-X9-DG protein